jgi:hypothetical protein
MVASAYESSDLVQQLEQEVSALVVVLKGHLRIEQLLLHQIAECPRLVSPERLDLDRLTFPHKLALAVAVGGVPPGDEPSFLAYNRLRNRVAHRLDFDVTTEQVSELRAGLVPRHRTLLEDYFADNPSTGFLDELRAITVFLLFILEAGRENLVEEGVKWREVNRRVAESFARRGARERSAE